MKVIAVDDEEDALALVTGAIKLCLPDSELHSFLLPSEALTFAEHNPIDVAFLDISMPSMSGMELAKKLKKINAEMNIIFATAYSDYMGDAFAMHASGYLIKPIGYKAVKNELDHLRAPLDTTEAPVYINTFGNFEILVNGSPVSFSRKPSKEVLAFLVDKGNTVVSKKEICATLFGDPEYTSKSMDYLSKIIRDIKQSLEDVGADNIFYSDRKECGIKYENVTCDSFEYLKGNPEYINKFKGLYMTQYEWAKDSIDKFYN